MKIIKIAQQFQTNVEQLPQPQQQATPVQPSQEQMREASNRFFEAALKFLMRDSDAVIEYMLNPSEASKQALAKRAVQAVVNGGIGKLTGLGWLSSKLGVGKAVAGNDLVRNVGMHVVEWIDKNIKLGRIPDAISSQNPKLKAWDLPDQMVTVQVEKTIENIQRKYAGNKQAIGLYITLLFRMKDRMDLMNAQLGLLQNAGTKKMFPAGIQKTAQSRPWYFDECNDAEAVAIAVLKHLERMGYKPRYLGFENRVATIRAGDVSFAFSEVGTGQESILRVSSNQADYRIRDFISSHHSIDDVITYIDQVGR